MNENVFFSIMFVFSLLLLLYGVLAVASKLPFFRDKLETFAVSILAIVNPKP